MAILQGCNEEETKLVHQAGLLFQQNLLSVIQGWVPHLVRNGIEKAVAEDLANKTEQGQHFNSASCILTHHLVQNYVQ